MLDSIWFVQGLLRRAFLVFGGAVDSQDKAVTYAAGGPVPEGFTLEPPSTPDYHAHCSWCGSIGAAPIPVQKTERAY